MEPLYLRSASTSLVISFDSGEAEVIHWGADLGDSLPDLAILGAPVSNSAVDAAVPAGLLPQASSSWRGRPALRGHRIADGVPGYDFSVRLRVAEVTAGRRRRRRHHPGRRRRRDPRLVRPHPARRRPAGTAPHRHQHRHLAVPARRTGHGPPGGAGRRRTPGPDRALVPGTPPAAPRHRAGNLGAHRPARPHRPRFLAALRRRNRRLRQPPRQGLGHPPGLERQPRTVRGHHRGRADHDRRLRTAGPGRGHPGPRRQLHDARAVRRLLGPRPGRHQRVLLRLVPEPAAPRAALPRQPQAGLSQAGRPLPGSRARWC